MAREIRASVELPALRHVTLVPMPPSKRRDDPLYDDRMLQVVRAIDLERQLDIRELVLLSVSMPAVHTTATRPTVANLVAQLSIDDRLVLPPPASIAIVDDVLTTGAHFVAAKTLLAARFPGIPIRGLFVARRVFDAPHTSPEDGAART